MAITATALTANTGGSAQSYDTASISPGSNRLILLACAAGTAGNTNPGTPTVSGNGLTWVQVGTNVNYDASGTTDRATAYLFRSMGASPTTGAITIDWGASPTLANAAWSVVEFDGVDTTGTNGSGTVVQSAQNSTAAATSLTVTLASAFGDATNNVAYGCFSHQINEGHTPGTGFAELADVFAAVGGKSISMMTEWVTGQDLTVDSSWTTSTRPGGLAVEIKAGATGTNANAEAAAATVTADNPQTSVAPVSEAASVTAVGQDAAPLIGPNAELADVVVAAQDATTTIMPVIEAALVTAAGQDAAGLIAPAAENAPVTVTAYDPTVITGSFTYANAEAATVAADAQDAGSAVAPVSEAASVTVAGQDPAAAVNASAQDAAVTVSGQDATATFTSGANAEAALVTVTAWDPQTSIAAQVEAALADITAFDALVTGAEKNATSTVTVTAGRASTPTATAGRTSAPVLAGVASSTSTVSDG